MADLSLPPNLAADPPATQPDIPLVASLGMERAFHLGSAIPLLKLIHGHDGDVGFFKPDPARGLRTIKYLRADQLLGMLPDFASDLLATSYFTVNAVRGRRRNGENVSHLTCCFADVDCHDSAEPERINEVIQRVFQGAKDGTIPLPSVIVESGRGIWLLWLLKESDQSERAVPATRENREIWRKIQHAITDRLATIGVEADPRARDLARIARTPSSVNEHVGRRVTHAVNANRDGNPIAYTLGELSEAFGSDSPTMGTGQSEPVGYTAPIELPFDPDRRIRERSKKSDRAAKGWAAVRNVRRQDFETLVGLRGGRIGEGNRNHAVLLLAWLYRRDPRQRSIAESFGRSRCAPPLSPREIENALKWANGRPPGNRFANRFANRTIGEMLGVTPEENRQLRGDYLTAFDRAAERAAQRDRVVGSREARRQRDELVSEICALNVPPLRTIVERLNAAGVKIHPQGVNESLTRLGIANPRSRTPGDRDCRDRYCLPLTPTPTQHNTCLRGTSVGREP